MAVKIRRIIKTWLLDRLYEECASIYDLVAMRISHGHWFLWGEAVIPFVQAPVLELGCGTGHLQMALAARGISAFGIDRSARMLRAARRRTTRIMRADTRWIPCADASQATVVAVFPAPYISEPQTLAEVARVLRPEGRLVILLSAGSHDVRAHPLWNDMHESGWHITTPDCVVGKTRLHVLIGTRHATYL
ncbi:MAG: hypothetical protein RLY87_992 [Chloroflexota bacterium]|jgi:ubiquinone/menaquinone biosynthesis C-methylase UbiE